MPSTVTWAGAIWAWGAVANRLVEPKPKLGQAGLPVTLETEQLNVRRRPRLQLRNQFHPPNQLRRQPGFYLLSSEPDPTRSAAYDFGCSRLMPLA